MPTLQTEGGSIQKFRVKSLNYINNNVILYIKKSKRNIILDSGFRKKAIAPILLCALKLLYTHGKYR